MDNINCKYRIKDTQICNYYGAHHAQNKEGIKINTTACHDERECPIMHPENLKNLIIDGQLIL